jgi:hypothetical protein
MITNACVNQCYDVISASHIESRHRPEQWSLFTLRLPVLFFSQTIYLPLVTPSIDLTIKFAVSMNLNTDSIQGRRKGPKQLPRLPLSVFTPPNSGTLDKFPLPPSPSTLHPENVVDAHVVDDPGLQKWQKEAGGTLGSRAHGVVVSASADKTGAEQMFHE